MSTILSNKIWYHRSSISYVLDCECLFYVFDEKEEREKERKNGSKSEREKERVRLCEKYENKSSFGVLHTIEQSENLQQATVH